MKRIAAVAMVLAVWGSVRADMITVPLTGSVNADIRSYTNGLNYPIAPTTLSVGGVPFDLVPLSGTPDSL